MNNLQSNSLRGKMMHDIVDRTVKEIHADISHMLGPGASDAFIVKDGVPYYTRDGKEVLESLRFDNELAMYVHHILYQAVYNQGQNVGDGSTTLGVLYCNLYNLIRNGWDGDEAVHESINKIRKTWKTMTEVITDELKKRAVPMTEDLLLSMLYTCTQDAELTGKIFTTLKEPIMDGAYIIPRKSNISTDFNVTVYNRPTFKATRQFSVRPIEGEITDAVVLYCNGILDVSHLDVFASIVATKISCNEEDPYQSRKLTYIILCHGMTEATRRTVRKLAAFFKDNNVDVAQESNLAIFTLDDYRMFDTDELEDISTMINDEPGLGGAVNPITYEHLLYAVFNTATQTGETIPELEQFDIDPHCIDKIKSSIITPYHVIIDPVEGLSICKELGPNANERYETLRAKIKEEKSPAIRFELTKRMRRIYGMFIEIEVGSVLLKDSQRKFELILDAILSSSEAAKDGVLIGNSMLHTIDIIVNLMNTTYKEKSLESQILATIAAGLCHTFCRLYNNAVDPDGTNKTELVIDDVEKFMAEKGWTPEDFNLIDPNEKIVYEPESLTINRRIVEPVGVMSAILKNSTVAMELARTDVFHVSGTNWTFGNYI